MSTYNVTFEPDGKTVTVEEGVTIARAAAAAEISINSPCGGEGTCGKCRVVVNARNVDPPNELEKKALSEEDLSAGYRLACQTLVTDDMTVKVPEDSRIAESKILSEGMEQEVELHPNIIKTYVELSEQTLENQIADLTNLGSALGKEALKAELDVLRKLPNVIRDSKFKATLVLDGDKLIDIEPGDTTGRKYGLAVDIGTTTVVCTVVDLNAGSDMGVASALNTQAVHGADVISRINYSVEDENGLQELHDRVVQIINEIAESACTDAGVNPDNVYEVTIVGNTTMTHLFLKIPVRNLALLPYVGVVSDPVEVTASQLGLNVNPDACVYVLPNIAGFVGADTVGVILASALHESDSIKLAIDIGTNGEVALGSRERLLTCSCAAGPALEGAMITHGMRAAPGAIERVKLDGQPICDTIEGEPPIGICGSGLIDLVSEMLRLGIVDYTGRMLGADDLGSEVPSGLKEYLSKNDEYGPHLVLSNSDEREVVITQKDIRQVQLAKGAIMAGVKILMNTLGVQLDDISEVLMAGAFGNYIQKESAIRMGLIPDFPLEKVKFIGNAAASGAKMALMSREARKTAEKISKNTEYTELAVDMNFQNEFIDAMMFPE
ncbi:ASKHA domain-containing protein [Candidatus Poribacteria bacterium]